MRSFSGLSPKLQSAAEYILAHPDEVATHSLRQVARKGGVSPPVLSRLARAVGYDDYEQLRDDCRMQMQHERVSLADRAAMMRTPEAGGAVKGAFAETHVHAAMANLQALIDGLDKDRLARAVERIVAARRVWLIGSQSSGAMAQYLFHMANLAAGNWSVIGGDTSSPAADIASMGEEDAVLAISVAPYLRQTIDLTRAAAGRGAEIVVVTDHIGGPLLQFGHHSFIVRTESPQFFPSHAAILTLLEIVMGMVIRRMGDTAQKRIEAVEKLNKTTGDYWSQS